MSTATQYAPVRPAVTTDPKVAAVPFSRVLRVELRKLVDTRAGFWLLAAIGIITVAVVVVFLFAADADELTYLHFVGVTATPQSILLPVLGILAITTEWSQRTGLVTFTLEASRGRVAGAKLLAVVLVGLLAVVVALVVAAVGNALGIVLVNGSGSWSIEGANIRDFVFLQLVGVVQGVAFAMLLMSTAAAVVLYFALPLAWNALFSLVGALDGAAPWLDFNSAIGPVYSGETLRGDDWAHVAVSGTIWVVVPFAVGLARLLRREVKSS
jgi:ABC-type transport system involved in multi-copper enzyme maturation permease subunit